MKKFNIVMTILNVIYLIFINVCYFELPAPDRTYLRDIKTEILQPNTFLNLSIIGLLFSLIFWTIYLTKSMSNRKEKRHSAFIILVEIIIIIIEILYQF